LRTADTTRESKLPVIVSEKNRESVPNTYRSWIISCLSQSLLARAKKRYLAFGFRAPLPMVSTGLISSLKPIG
jgi:hypothetical protein